MESLTLSDLAISERLEIRGYQDGNSVVAVEIDREDFDERARLRGPVTAEDEAAGTLGILNVRVKGEAGITEFEDANESVIGQSEFHTQVELGTFVKADWDLFFSTDETANSLSIED